jgi:site-specific DNA-methyltransferase (adenine-specific)
MIDPVRTPAQSDEKEPNTTIGGERLAWPPAGPEWYYVDDDVALAHGDCRNILPELGPVDVVVTDPPYGDTSLEWDVPVRDWLGLVDAPQVWCFGSMRFWLEHGDEFAAWTYGQEIIWEKHNGSGFHADRFRRVHELAVHWYRGEWRSLHHEPPLIFAAVATVIKRRKQRPPHMGAIGDKGYESEDGGPKLMRSVQYVRSEHGHAVHRTQKPLGILRPLIEYSCPTAGLVLDPFAGSGSTLLAARELGRRAIGIESELAHCEAAVARLSQGVLL